MTTDSIKAIDAIIAGLTALKASLTEQDDYLESRLNCVEQRVENNRNALRGIAHGILDNLN